MSLDYIFGRGTSRKIPFRTLRYEYSRKTGRLRYVIDPAAEKVLFSFRPNGSIAPTIAGARLLLGGGKVKPGRVGRRPRYAVTVLDGVGGVVSEGRNVFCKHVVSCHSDLLPAEDVLVVSEGGELLAVGKTLVSGAAMKQFKRGVAIKVREGVGREGNGPTIV